MSKAFTKEDNQKEQELPENDGPALPSNTKNYITPYGAKKLRDELQELNNVERPKVVESVAWAAALGDRSENAEYIYGKKRLREIDRRIRFLSKRLDNIEVIDPTQRQPVDQIFFGATTLVKNEEGEEKTYSIVGIDETDATKGKVSWISPIGKALLKSKVGEVVSFISPKGEVTLEILKVEYKAID